MARVSLIPVAHQVFNEFDRHGVLLGLRRLELEKNPVYKKRLLDVFVNRSSSTYLGLINGITRELGLSIIKVLTIVPVLDGNGVALLPEPAVVFEETKCTLYNNFCDRDVLLEIDRFEVDEAAFSIDELVILINATGFFTATKFSGIDGRKRSMTIFNQSSIKVVPVEDISDKGSNIRLDNINLIENSVALESSNLIERVSVETDLVKPGQYFVDLVSGTVKTTSVPAPGSVVRYQYRDDEFVVKASPVIIHNIQSDDFRTKMFETVDDGGGSTTLSQSTVLGAFIINELLSVFPSSWGP